MFQSRGRRRAAGSHPAINGKGKRHQRVPEEQALDLRQRQDTLDDTRTLGIEKMRTMPEDLTHDALPPGLVEKGGFLAGFNERVPAIDGPRVVGIQAADADRHGRYGSKPGHFLAAAVH
jgi:hypothetical protein